MVYTLCMSELINILYKYIYIYTYYNDYIAK